MSTYKRFEDLPVWQTAATLYERCDDFLEHVPARMRYLVRDQLERAALSVSNNIAEGFERGTKAELLTFLYIARGSAGEVRSMLLVMLRRPWISDCKPEVEQMIALAESCSRQLRAWADTLQNSDITGPRNLNEQSRNDWQKQQTRSGSAARFHEMQRQQMLSLAVDHPMCLDWERKHGPLDGSSSRE
jgi:four helix bundle protein